MDVPCVPPPAEHAPPVDDVEHQEQHREDAEEDHVCPGEPLTVSTPGRGTRRLKNYIKFESTINAG